MRIVPALGLVLLAGACGAAELTVGPGKSYAKPSLAAAAAHDGDTVSIDAGTYSGDVCVWTASNLTLRGVGGRAHLEAAGHYAAGKGIWVLDGNNTTVEDIEFSGAAVPDLNGAGIRLDGSGLTVRRCFFHDNEDGILTNAGATSDILIENSEFADNGAGDGYSHNLYIGNVRSLVFRGNYSHGADQGHLFKSRSQLNVVVYNRFMDGATGQSSYAIDLPNGGLSVVVGNLIEQGPNTANTGIVMYGEEGGSNTAQRLYFVNNTLVNDLDRGTFLNVAAGTTEAKAINNLFVGPGAHVVGPVTESHDLGLAASALANAAAYDYHLAAGSAAIDAGVAPGTAQGYDLTPVSQYVDQCQTVARAVAGAAIDVGAFEFPSAGGTTTGGGTTTTGGGTTTGGTATTGGGTSTGGTTTGGGTSTGGTTSAGSGTAGGASRSGCGLGSSAAFLIALGIAFARRRGRG